MCFKNLPIDFDVHGRAQLRDAAWGEPFTPRQRVTTLEQRVSNSHLRDFDIDPVTRVAGALSFHTVIDLERRQAVEARTEATLFRGYKVILQGREPTDAIHISSRACGVCGGVHATCAAMALEMACGVVPPPLAIIARNLGEGAELVYDHILHLVLLAGRTAMSVPYTIPQEAIGVGFGEAGRGILTHHVVLERGRIANYQIITPSTWMASPQDPFGAPGPYEEAVRNTPLLEEFARAEDFTGIDILGTIRSFDPCMPCTVHMAAGGRVLHRDATTCMCGDED